MSKSAAPLAPNVVCYKGFHPGIMEDLDFTFGLNSPAFQVNANGVYDTHAAALRDGNRRVLLHIQARIHAATHEQKDTQQTNKA